MYYLPNQEDILRVNKTNAQMEIEVYEAFQEESRHPFETNEALLLQILEDNKDTEYGRKYNFQDIKSIKEYQARVPVVEYNALAPYLERMLNGEKNILTAYPYSHMCQTSGTVGKQKLVPLTDRQSAIFLKYNRRYTDGFLAKHLPEHWMEGRCYRRRYL